jgi:glycosyltransferase involved in cell wall biosynthesis
MVSAELGGCGERGHRWLRRVDPHADGRSTRELTMTIYVNARFLTHEVTGVERYSREISRRLVELRDDLVFLVPPGLRDESLDDILTVRTIGTASGHRWEQFDLPRYLRRQGSPLLLSLMNTAPVTYRNQISTKHDITYVRFPQSYSRSFRTFYRFMVPLALKRSRAVITVSEFSRTELQSYYLVKPEKIHVVSAAAGSEFVPSDPLNPEGEPYLLALSSPSAHKNFDRLIEAFHVANFSEPVTLKIVGGQSKSLQGTGQAVGDRITFLGRLSDREVIDLYCNATAFVFPSLYEGFGIPPLEAQACGTPVLASNPSSIPEVLGGSALYFDPYDIDSIASSMERIIRDSTLRHQLAADGLRNVARFSWTDSAQKVSDLIDSLSTPNQAPRTN